MLVVDTPTDQNDLDDYYRFRWEYLRKPWGFPEGSEKDEYEYVSEHRILKNNKGEIVACGRVHLNTSEEAQIRHIAVHNEHRDKGVGQMILEVLEKVALELGAERAVSHSTETSLGFFLNAGFAVIDDAPVELGKLKRKMMCKPLRENQALILHPSWCNELQELWHEQIPITEQMGVKLYQYTERTLETRASLNKNINIHGTMFAGSIYSLATLTGWGMIYLQLKQRKIAGEIALGDASIHYHKPITNKPRAVCNIESINAKFENLSRGKKCPISLKVDILDDQKSVADFSGQYWVIPPETNKKASAS